MTKIKRTKTNSKSSTQLSEEVKEYRKAKVAFRVYASIGAFDKALDELMKLNRIACWSKHPYITGDSQDGF